MKNIKPAVSFFLHLAKAQAILTHRFDRGLGGISFSEFLILLHLDQSEDKKMRRIDLAEKIGMTASGITRMLLPMEKIGLIKSGPNQEDARARFVQLASGGRQKLSEALERVELLAEDIIPSARAKEVGRLSDLLVDIGGRVLMK